MIAALERVNLLILDDWGPEPLTVDQRRDLLEIVDDRYDKGSLLITSQVPCRNGMMSLPIPPSVTRYWIASFTMRTASNSRPTVCGAKPAKRKSRERLAHDRVRPG
ncbi:DNA replication protein DnaC [Bradyrhizobium sp. GM22.5]